MKLTQGNVTKQITVAALTKFLEANSDKMFFDGEFLTQSCVVAKFAQEKFGTPDIFVNGVEVGTYVTDVYLKLKSDVCDFIFNVDGVANFNKISGKDILSRLSQ